MSNSVKLRIALAATLAALGFPASSMAASCAPPGNAGVDQYFETVPGANCNHGSGPSGPGSGGHTGGGGGSLPSGTSSQLAKHGAVGQAVKQLVASSGVTSGGGSAAGGSGGSKGHSKSSGKSTVLPTANLPGSGRNPISGLLHPVLTGSSSGGIGVLLPVLLVLALALALLTTVLRRRFRSTGPQT